MGDVQVGVEAQLAEPPADLRHRGHQLVAQEPEGRLERLRRAEQLLLARLPLGAERRARLLGERRRRLARAALGGLGVGQHEPLARAGHGDVEAPPHLRDVHGLRVGRERLLEQGVRDRLQRALARARHPRGHQPEHVDVVELAALGRVHGHHLHGARPLAGHRLLLAQARPPPPRRSSGRTRARWPAGSGARSSPPARRTWPGSPAARPPRWRPRTAAGGAGRAARSGGGRRGRGASSPARPPPTRYMRRKPRMRSRASGGICGDSSAAPSAATMSSLRRREIWVQRAMSIERSSTGGRASARTTAPASPGSTHAAAARPAGRAPPRAGRTRPRPPAGAERPAPRAPRRPPGPRP